MVRKIIAILFIVLACGMISPAMGGEKFPDLRFVDGTNLSDVGSEFAFIEVYSMYCPICQRDAHHVNDLYAALSAKADAKKLVFMGVAAGNTPFEVEFYRKKFNVKFPLHEDPDYSMHKAVGGVGTPAYYLVDMREGRMDVLLFHLGEIEAPDKFLADILKKMGE